MTRATRQLTPAELAEAMRCDAATFERPNRPMLVRPGPKRGTIRVALVWSLCVCALIGLAFSERVFTAHVAHDVWGE